MRKILFFLLSTFVCTSLYAVSIDNSSDIIYAEDGLSAELEIGSKYFDGDEHICKVVHALFVPCAVSISIKGCRRSLHSESGNIESGFNGVCNGMGGGGNFAKGIYH